MGNQSTVYRSPGFHALMAFSDWQIVVWLKYNLNINKTGIFAIQVYFLYFFIVKNDQCTFFNGKIRFYFYPNRLRIDTGTLV